MIDFQRLPDHVGIAAEVALPEAVVKDNNGVAAVLCIGWLEVAAEKRAHTKETPGVLCEVGARDLFRKRAAGDLHPVGLKPSTESTGAARRRSSNCALLRANKAKPCARRCFSVKPEEVRDAVGVGIRKRVQQDGVDE